jgi:hypothetical protein
MLRCFALGPSRSRGSTAESLEVVSEQQLSQTCLAAYVKDGSVWLAFADGRHEAVDRLLAARSPMLQFALESAGEKSEYLQHRERIFQWYQYVQAVGRNEPAEHAIGTLIYLRQLLVRDRPSSPAT